MANREKSRSSCFVLGSNRLVKTSYRHTRHITMQPDISLNANSSKVFTHELEFTNNEFFRRLNDSTNRLSSSISKLKVHRQENRDHKFKQILSLREEINNFKNSRKLQKKQ